MPFYYYDIPVMTGVLFPMPDFLDRAALRIPSFAGIKFTNPDLMAYLRCLRSDGGRFDVAWGIDEYLLAAVALGAAGAVGSSYNFAAPIYHRLLAAMDRGDLAAAPKSSSSRCSSLPCSASSGIWPPPKPSWSDSVFPSARPGRPTAGSPRRSSRSSRRPSTDSAFPDGWDKPHIPRIPRKSIGGALMNRFTNLSILGLAVVLISATLPVLAQQQTPEPLTPEQAREEYAYTIGVQLDSPGKDKESNWLPAAKGDFSLSLRCYLPRKAILDGTWKPPTVKPVE